MITFQQLSMLDELAATLRTESEFHATLRPSNTVGTGTPETPAKRTRTQHDSNTCPLCRGAMDGNVCTRCGMECEL